MKLSRRERYILKWNGPQCVANKKRERADAKRQMGHGSEDQRLCATAYMCRFRGFYPRTDVELCRLAGVPNGQIGRVAQRNKL